MLYTTKTLTRDGLTYTAEFQDQGEAGYRVTGFRIAVGSQSLDAFKGCPSHWTEAEGDAWFIKTHPQLSMVAEEVYTKGLEVFEYAETRVA